jgi:hypothetical protein
MASHSMAMHGGTPNGSASDKSYQRYTGDLVIRQLLEHWYDENRK